MTYDIQNTFVKNRDFKETEAVENKDQKSKDIDGGISNPNNTLIENQDNEIICAGSQSPNKISDYDKGTRESNISVEMVAATPAGSCVPAVSLSSYYPTEPFEYVSNADVELKNECTMLVRNRSPRQSDMYTTALGIL